MLRSLTKVPLSPESQQKALVQAQVEIESLKQESAIAKERQRQLEQKLVIDAKKSNNLSISAEDIKPYLSGVVKIECFGQDRARGSGSLWNFGGNLRYTVLTNRHVITTNNCKVFGEDFPGRNLGVPIFNNWNNQTDVAVLNITSGITSIDVAISDLNYKVSSLKKCPSQMFLGSPLVIVGYPAFAEKDVDYGDGIGSLGFQAVTNGIISAHDTSVLGNGTKANLPYVNYFVSAKIDSGNSGGIAFSKDSNGLCLLGISTWLTVGNYETQGLIQNIHNVFYQR